MDDFDAADWEWTEASGMNLTYQGRPPQLPAPPVSPKTAIDPYTYAGSPCNWTSTTQIQSMTNAVTQWPGTGMLYFLWSNRWDNDTLADKNKNPNRQANNIAPAFKRSRPLDWKPNTEYKEEEFVYADGKWWVCVVPKTLSTHTTFSSGDGWSEVAPADAYRPEARIEYTSLAKAMAANVIQARWAVGRHDYTEDGKGYRDAAGYASAGLDAENDILAHANLATAVDTTFTDRATNEDKDHAVTEDIVYLPPSRLADWWADYVPGTDWLAGTLIRDQGNLLPNNFANYGASAYTDSATGITPANTAKTIANGYCELTGANRAVRQKFLLPATSGVTYELRVTGKISVPVAIDPTYNPSGSALKARVRLQVFGLDASGAEVPDSHKETNFTAFNTQHTFTLRQKFAASASGSDVKAWPANATHLRFSVNTNGGFGGTVAANAQVLIESILVTVAGTTPTYWRTLAAHTSPESSGSTFATFAADRATNEEVYKLQKLGIELDHEVSDCRAPADLTSYLAELRAITAEEGYVFKVYTNSLDSFLDLQGTANSRSVATKNGFAESNLDAVLASCDVLTSVVSGANYRGNDAAAVMSAIYNRVAYADGDQDGVPDNYAVEREHFRDPNNGNKPRLGFALEMPDRVVSSAPIQGITKSGDRIKLKSVEGNGAQAKTFLKINGLKGALGTALNNKTFRVYSNSATTLEVQIDALFDEIDTDTDLAVTSALPDITGLSYEGGGYFETYGLTPADYGMVRSEYFQGQDVTHFGLWRRSAVQKQDAPTAPISITEIEVTTDTPRKVIVKTAADTSWTRFFVAGLTHSDLAVLNGTSYVVTPIASQEFELVGYNGDQFASGTYPSAVLGSGQVSNAFEYRVNEKIDALVAIPATP